MQTAIKLKTRVLPGKRIEVDTPQLTEGEDVELIVLRQDASPDGQHEHQPLGVWDYIQSLPAGPRSAATWEEIEQNFQEERDSWER